MDSLDLFMLPTFLAMHLKNILEYTVSTNVTDKLNGL